MGYFPRYLAVPVTRDDLDQGKPGDPEACPVKLALDRAYPHLRSRVFVDSADLGVMTYKLTTATATKIFRFDRHKPVQPFTARLYNPKKQPGG